MKHLINMLISAGYDNKEINYAEFIDLYNLYGSKYAVHDFIKIIGISDNDFIEMKNNNKEVVLHITNITIKKKTNKKIEKISTKRKEEIRNELVLMGYENKAIDYIEYFGLYKSYEEEVSQKEFWKIIGLIQQDYFMLKKENKTVVILNQRTKEQIKQELIAKGYADKKINYNEYLELYKIYEKVVSEIGFRKILGILRGSFSQMLYDNNNTIILKTEINAERKTEISAERKKEIVIELFLKYKGICIDYAEFLKLYAPYENEVREIDFREILGIHYAAFYRMKNKNKTIEILKNIRCYVETYTEMFSLYFDKYENEDLALEAMASNLTITKKQLLEIMKEELLSSNMVKESKDKVYYIKQ